MLGKFASIGNQFGSIESEEIFWDRARLGKINTARAENRVDLVPENMVVHMLNSCGDWCLSCSRIEVKTSCSCVQESLEDNESRLIGWEDYKTSIVDH